MHFIFIFVICLFFFCWALSSPKSFVTIIATGFAVVTGLFMVTFIGLYIYMENHQEAQAVKSTIDFSKYPEVCMDPVDRADVEIPVGAKCETYGLISHRYIETSTPQ